MDRTGVIFIFCCSGLFSLGCSQKLQYTLPQLESSALVEIKNYGTQVAQDILQKECRIDKNREKYWDGTKSESRRQYQYYDVGKMNIIPISLFKIDNKAINYSGNIVQYLKWEKNEVLGFYTYENDKFFGLLDWSEWQHRHIGKECLYYTIEDNHFLEYLPIYKGLIYLLEHRKNLSLLFGVRYFVNTLWFIEHNKVFVLDLKEMQIYDPEEFIKEKCDDGFIQVIANGGKNKCNY